MQRKSQKEIEIPDPWLRAAEEILAGSLRRILVLGATDVGKSTFVLFLVRYLSSRGKKVAIVDADIGQKDLGPPATVSLGITHRPVTRLRTLRPLKLYFVGSVTPRGHLLPLVIGSQILLKAARSDFAIINTTGLIKGPGRRLKAFKIELLRPQVIVALERGEELSAILKTYPWVKAIRLKPAPSARTKSPETRRHLREIAFRDYFSKAKVLEIPFEQVAIWGSLLLSGRPQEIPQTIWAEETSEGLLVVSQERPEGRLKCIHPRVFTNLLCGVVDYRGHCLGLAILERIDFANRKLLILTPVAQERIRLISPGSLYLRPDGRELGRGHLPF
ncbi:Clp1/GlmU family protein [Thermosulfuriphilus sp.]